VIRVHQDFTAFQKCHLPYQISWSWGCSRCVALNWYIGKAVI